MGKAKDSSTAEASTSMQNGLKMNFLGSSKTVNPYVSSYTNNSGTTTTLQPNTAYSSIYNFTNQNMDKLLNDYLNPQGDPLQSAQNQALIEAYTRNLGNQSRTALENNIINPLTERRMINSSQALDLYNQLAKQQNNNIADYTAQLLADSKNDTANQINTLMNLVNQGYNVISGNQAQSLQTSNANGMTNSLTNGMNYGQTMTKN